MTVKCHRQRTTAVCGCNANNKKGLRRLRRGYGTEEQWYQLNRKTVNDDTEVLLMVPITAMLYGVVMIHCANGCWLALPPHEWAGWWTTNPLRRRKIWRPAVLTATITCSTMIKPITKKHLWFAMNRGTGKMATAVARVRATVRRPVRYLVWRGQYTDVVARIVSLKAMDIKPWRICGWQIMPGAQPERVEYGKTIKVNREQGTFIEPQVQLQQTFRKRTLYYWPRTGGVMEQQLIGRVGLVAVRPKTAGVIFISRVLPSHEFGGRYRCRSLSWETLATKIMVIPGLLGPDQYQTQ